MQHSTFPIPLLLQWHSIDYIEKERTDFPLFDELLRENTLFLIVHGEGSFTINGEYVPFQKGSVIGIESANDLFCQINHNKSIQLWKLSFNVYEQIKMNTEEEHFRPSRWKAPSDQGFSHIQLTWKEVELFHQKFCHATEQPLHTAFLIQSLGGALIGQLYDEIEMSDEETIEQKILRTIDYMKKYYPQQLTRKTLADVAKISESHFSRSFRHCMKEAPSAYLTRLRIDRAVELLLTTNVKVEKIAHEVGFEDPFYFSRRFKEKKGVAPTNYRNHITKGTILVTSPSIAEILLSIGIVPTYLLTHPPLLADHFKTLLDEHNVHIIPRTQFQLNIAQVEQCAPDLILCNAIHESDKVKLRNIAPTLDFASDSFLDLYRKLTTVWQKEEAFKQLLLVFHRETLETKLLLQMAIQEKKTAVILRIEPFGYRVLGYHVRFGVSHLLHNELGIHLPKQFQHFENWATSITMKDLAQANPDYLFVELRHIEGYDATHYLDRFLHEPYYTQLRAVQQKRVHFVETALWIDGYSTIGRRQIMEQIVQAITAEAQCSSVESIKLHGLPSNPLIYS